MTAIYQLSLLEMPTVPNIPGLQYFPDYITPEEEANLAAEIEAAGWQDVGMQRRVRQFGYRYSFSRRSMAPGDFREALPAWADAISQRLYRENLLPAKPNQLLANRYLPGERISFHVDAPEFNEIADLSLLSACVMEFRNVKTGEKQKIWLERRSLLLLTGESRWNWQHAIPYRKRDRYAGREQDRETRISLTFRIVGN